MDFVYTTQFPVTPVHVDCFGRCKPSSLLRFAQNAAEEHCHLLGTDWDSMAKKRYFWAVIRQRIQFTRYPKAGQTVTVKTWPLPTTRVAYPRAAEGYDEEGNLLFQLISLWVIVDMDSRTMVLPGKSGVNVEGTVLGTELKIPSGIPTGTSTHSQLRTVSYSDLDVNGHMNNTRYLDWICDLLPSAFHKDHPLKAASIFYMTEALEGQQLQLNWSGEEILLVDGSLTHTDVDTRHTRIFSAQLEF